ncbi:MAG: hypothetical protein HFH76_17250 [Lachnospiraceae bacterium]|jgi:hypothetical protein|nr:hypothetical protein [Lachnospiraceae bacterium]
MTTFVGIIDRPETLTTDGYSSAKTLNGVMSKGLGTVQKQTCKMFEIH